MEFETNSNLENHIKRVIHVDDPATEPQLDFLRRLGATVEGPLTKKEASDLIDQMRAS